MLTTLGQYVTGKAVTIILASCGVLAGIYFWQHPEAWDALLHGVKYGVIWLGIVLALPWASFFIVSWVIRLESNRAAGLMLLGFTLCDALLAIWFMGGLRGHGTLGWGVVLFGLLAAAVYNFKVCEYQAERAEDAI